jgi:hypothetical protein
MKNKTEAYVLRMKEKSAFKIKTIRILAAFLIFVCWFGGSAFAQDLLILKSGKELKVNIIQETADIIQYREYDNPAGPLYSVAKDKVASVKYKKETRNTQETRVGEPEKPAISAPVQGSSSAMLTVKRKNVYLDGMLQSPRSVSLLMEDQPEALRLYESGKRLVKLSNVCPYGIILTSFIVTQSVNKKKTSEEKIRAGIPGLAIDGGLLIAAIIMATSGKSKIKASVNMYNSAISKPVTYKLDIGIQGNGIGLTLRF